MNQTSLATLPDTLNGFIFHTDKGVVSSALAHDLPGADLEGIGRILSQLYAMVSTESVKDIRLAFDTVAVTVRQTDEQAFAVIISDPGVSEGQVAALMDPYIPAFIKGCSRPVASGNTTKVPGPEAIEEQLHSGPVSTQLQALLARLFKSAGPLARVIFRDALRQWLGQGSASEERLEDLVRILMQEIRDPEKAEHYRAGLPQDLTGGKTLR